jgi:hypothetical protein
MTAEMAHALTRYDSFLVELGYPSSGLALSGSRRTLAALFPVINPIMDATSRLKFRVVRPLFKSYVRLTACVAMLLFVGEFLLPGQWLQAIPLASDEAQPIFAGAVALIFGLAFGPALLRRSPGRYAWLDVFVQLSRGMLTTVGVLEAAQNFSPDRIAAWSDLLHNAGAVVLGSFAALALLRARAATRLPALGA